MSDSNSKLVESIDTSKESSVFVIGRLLGFLQDVIVKKANAIAIAMIDVFFMVCLFYFETLKIFKKDFSGKFFLSAKYFAANNLDDVLM
jgi:hypothetical protein